MPRLPIYLISYQFSSAFIDGRYLIKGMRMHVHMHTRRLLHSNAVWIDVTPTTIAKILHIQDCQPI